MFLFGRRHLDGQARPALLSQCPGAEQDSRADKNNQQSADKNSKEAASAFVCHDEISSA
jgi:hypothetical protein